MSIKQTLKRIPFIVWSVNKARNVKHILKNGRPYPRVQRKIDTVKWIGNDYGGFGVDIANVPENPIVYSFGIGEDISFDLQMIKEFNAQVYGFDPTPKSINWVKNNVHEPAFHFLPYGLSDKNEVVQFHLPREGYPGISCSVIQWQEMGAKTVDVEMKTFATFMHMNGHERIDILKMDIEGSEFHCMPDIMNSNTGGGIKQLCVEVHNRYFSDGKKRLKKFIKLLNKKGFVLVFVSNSLDELTFVRKD